MPLNFAASVLIKRKEELIQAVLKEGKYTDVLHLSGPFTRDLSTNVYQYLIPRTFDETTTVLVSINSGGGDPDAAYQIFKILKKKFGKVEFAVPRMAKSAATLLALSGDLLYMSQVAELGPVDIQIEIDTDTWISGNSVRDSINRINGMYAKNPEVAKEWLKQLNPVIFAELDRKNEIVVKYANKMWVNPQKEMAIAKLTKEYPHHGYVVDIDEVRELGFKVEELEKRAIISNHLLELARIDQVLSQLSEISQVYERYKDFEEEI